MSVYNSELNIKKIKGIRTVKYYQKLIDNKRTIDKGIYDMLKQSPHSSPSDNSVFQRKPLQNPMEYFVPWGFFEFIHPSNSNVWGFFTLIFKK